jgi:hypothetical protein
MRRAIFILALLLSGGMLSAHDAAAAQPAPGKKTEQGAAGKKTVCVVSDVVHHFGLKKIGVMVFGNEFSTVPITQWKLDEKISAKTKAVLAKSYVVKYIPAPDEAFKPMREATSIFSDRAGARRAVMQPLTSGSTCDFVLFVTGNASQYASTNQYVGGLGVVETGSEIFGVLREIHALTFLYLFDGKSFEVIGYNRGESAESTLFKSIHGPSQQIDSKSHASLQAVADDPKTRDIVASLIDTSLDLTLPILFKLDAPKSGTPGAQAVKRKEDWAPF